MSALCRVCDRLAKITGGLCEDCLIAAWIKVGICESTIEGNGNILLKSGWARLPMPEGHGKGRRVVYKKVEAS